MAKNELFWGPHSLHGRTPNKPKQQANFLGKFENHNRTIQNWNIHRTRLFNRADNCPRPLRKKIRQSMPKKNTPAKQQPLIGRSCRARMLHNNTRPSRVLFGPWRLQGLVYENDATGVRGWPRHMIEGIGGKGLRAALAGGDGEAELREACNDEGRRVSAKQNHVETHVGDLKIQYYFDG